jgi:hypothetical protein
MMEAVRTSETSVDNHFTRQYIPEDNSERDLISLHFSFGKESWLKVASAGAEGCKATSTTEV